LLGYGVLVDPVAAEQGLLRVNFYEKMKKNNHSFDIDNAKKYGIIAAIIFNNIHHWLEVNEAKGENIRKYSERQKEKNDVDIPALENKTYVWTYNSVSEFKKLFPYLTEKQIRTALEKLRNKKVVLAASFNKFSYDRTLWYTIPNEFCQQGKWICPPGQMDLPIKANGFDHLGEPIPDSKPDSKQSDINTIVSIVPDGTSIFSTGDNILVTIGEYEDGNQLAIIEEAPKLPEKPKSAGALLNEAMALFQPIFPGDFIGKQTAFSKPPTREAVQALLDRIGVGGIKLLLEKYNNKKSEKFCPLAGTVYEFCTFKLAKIEGYVNKDGGLYAQRSISSPEHRSDLERKIAAKFEASREENRQALKEWLKTHPDDGMRRH